MLYFTYRITLVVDVLDAVKTQKIPLMLESVLEVSHKSWLVKSVDMQDSGDARESETAVEESRLHDGGGDDEQDTGRV